MKELSFYHWPSPNSRRVAIMLEECGLDYELELVDLIAGANRSAEFLQISAAGAVPVLIDHAAPNCPLILTQSVAILRYLARRSGHLLEQDPISAARVDEMLSLIISDLAAAAVARFLIGRADPDSAHGAFFRDRLRKFLVIADAKIAENGWLANDFSLADIALYPISVLPVAEEALAAGEPLKALIDWRARLALRPAVARAMALGEGPSNV